MFNSQWPVQVPSFLQWNTIYWCPDHVSMCFPGGSDGNKSACRFPMWETWVQSLTWEDPLENGMATHSSILAWRISFIPVFLPGVQSMELQELDMTEQLTLQTKYLNDWLSSLSDILIYFIYFSCYKTFDYLSCLCNLCILLICLLSFWPTDYLTHLFNVSDWLHSTLIHSITL